MLRSFAALTLCTRRGRLALGLLWLVAASQPGATPASAITIQFDYSYDLSGLFGTAAAPTPARTALEFAGRTFTAFTDTLAAIEPGGGDSWVAQFRDPGSGGQTSLQNLIVPQDVILIYAGARNLSGSKLGEAGPGFYTFPPGSTPSAAFSDAVVNRGQGASADDFAPWGGFIEFDTTSSSGAPRPWHFDLYAPPTNGAFDFHTVAVHELAHLLGFGTSPAFSADVASGQFIGATASELYGGPIPLHTDNQHWAATVGSPPFAAGTRPKPSLGPTLSPGERKVFTPLDYAALADVGWSVTPELLRLPGDADGDDDVDGTDFLIWQRNLGGFGGSQGDVNGDLIVDAYDGWIVCSNFGAVGSSAALGGAPIPEPGTAMLFAGCAVLLVRHLRSGMRGMRRAILV